MNKYNENNSRNINDEEGEEIFFVADADEEELVDEFDDEEEFDDEYEDEDEFAEGDMLALIDTATMNASDLAKLVIENNYRNGERLETEDIYRIYSESFSNILAIAVAHKI